MTVAMKPDIADFQCTILAKGRRPMPENSTPGFREKVLELFPDTQSARLSRQFDVKQRTAQLWMKGEQSVPDEIVEWVDSQHSVLETLTIGDVDSLVDAWLAAGIEREVIAAHLSRIYTDLTGMPIR